ncbi:Ig-like domain-containing protein [Spirochaetota bacterium]
MIKGPMSVKRYFIHEKKNALAVGIVLCTLSILLLCTSFFSCSNPFGLKIPLIISVEPEHEVNEVLPDSSIEIRFSREMDHVSVENAFSLTKSTVKMKGDFEWEDDVMTFTPHSHMSPGYTYYITVSRNAKSNNGTKIKSKHISSFTVGTKNIYPRITAISPANGCVINIDRPDIILTFDRDMDKDTVEESFSITPGVNGRYEWTSSKVLKFALLADISYYTEYQIKVGKEAACINGYKMEDDFNSFFRYGSALVIPSLLGIFRLGDAAFPISDRYFAYNETNVSKFTDLVFHFNTEMDRISVENGCSISPYIDGSYEKTNDVEGNKIIFRPDEELVQNTTYSITLSESIHDIYNVQIDKEYRIYFTVSGADSLPVQITNLIAYGNVYWQQNTLTNITNTSFPVDVFFKPAMGASMDISSVQENISIVRFAGIKGTNYAGTLSSFLWSAGDTVMSMNVSYIAAGNYYKLTFRGGEGGIKDTFGNYMEADVIYMFYFEP